MIQLIKKNIKKWKKISRLYDIKKIKRKIGSYRENTKIKKINYNIIYYNKYLIFKKY